MNNQYKIEVGKKIHKCRKNLKMSMKTLGEKVNLHESTVSRYEKGEIQSLDIEKLKDFADALNVSTSYLLSWDEVTAPNTSDSEEETVFFSMHPGEARARKKWFEQVGKMDWTDKENNFLLACALFAKETRHRDDYDYLLELSIKIMEQFKK